jgi:hypothetical protein
MKTREIQNFKRNILSLGVSETEYLKLLYHLSSLSEAMAEAVPGSLKGRGLELSIFQQWAVLMGMGLQNFISSLI